MIEFLSIISRLVAVAGAAAIIGSTVFRYGCMPAEPRRASISRRRTLLIAAALVGLGHAGLILGQGMTLAQAGTGAIEWRSLVTGTHMGRVWVFRAILAGLLLLTALAAATRGSRLAAWSCAALAVGYLALGPWSGHGAGAESPSQVLLPNIVHVLAIAVWVGALPSWLMAVRAYARDDGSTQPTAVLAAALKRFSHLAMVLMTIIVATGLWLANQYILNAGDLLGTRYGALVLGKIALLGVALLFANHLRTRFLPALSADGDLGVQRIRAAGAVRHIGGELLAASGILFCAAWLAQTPPALHEIAPVWWLPFRWSIDAAWADPSLRVWIVGALLAAIIGSALALSTRHTTRRIAAAVLACSGMGVLAWAMAVKAYPDTYRRSQTPYLTLSVASGRTLYLEHCTACHGDGGLGDGVLAAQLPRPPANLSEPHTALHTAGDMHWWLSHGIPESGMPGLGEALSENDRWDLINFLRAFSQGFESRVLESSVVAGQAWLGAINFYIEGNPGLTELKGYREAGNVLLVFLGGPDALARASTLAAAYPELRRRHTQVLVVPLAPTVLPTDLPYPVLSTGGAEIWSAYELLTRTAGDRGMPDRLGMEWNRAEILIDRFGYVRARWIAQDDPRGWADPVRLYPELESLNAEPRLRPPPDDHIH